MREVALRSLACLSVVGLLYFYQPSLLWPMWAFAYLGCLALCYVGLDQARSVLPDTARVALYMMLLLIFTSLPTYMVISGDQVLAFCGTCGLVGLAVWTLFRVDPPRIVLPADIARGWLVCGVAAWSVASMSETLAAKATVVAISIVLATYYTMALVQKRAAVIKQERSARRVHEVRQMEAVGRLSGGIAHDFNNILTAVQGSLELYHEVPEGPERDALVKDAREASARASALVTQLLSFARRAKLEAEPIATADVLEELASLSRRMLPATVAFECRDGPAGLKVLADHDSLISALLNLVANARDAVGTRGEVIVSCEMCEGSARDGGDVPALNGRNAHVRFTVADDGPGMPPEVESRAFEPFFSTKAVGQGSGLGLPMAKGFTEQSGGTLRLTTSATGTTVAMHLPLAVSEV